MSTSLYLLGHISRKAQELALEPRLFLLCAPLKASSLLNHWINELEQHSQVQYITTPHIWKVFLEARSEEWINEIGKE